MQEKRSGRLIGHGVSGLKFASDLKQASRLLKLAGTVASSKSAHEIRPNAPTDSQLWEDMRRGSESAFLEIYRRHQQAVFSYAWRMSGNATLAEDVTQEAFIVLLGSSPNFDPSRGTLSRYLMGIARNQVLRWISGNSRHVPFDADAPEGGRFGKHAASEASLLDGLVQAEGIERLRQAVISLPAHYREVVVLCDLEEMSYADAASVLDCPLGTVRSRLSRAHALLIEKLQTWESCAGNSVAGRVKEA